jgi:hypothetical protein
MIERRYRTTARGYILSPELLGRLGVPQAQAEDAFSAGYLLGLLSLGQLELGRASREAAAQSKRLATLSMNSELRFESAEQRARFTAELQRAIVELTARHASPFIREDGTAGAGRPYRLILGCYPIPPKPSEERRQRRKILMSGGKRAEEFEHKGRVLRAEIETSATPQQAWEAWADPEISSTSSVT